MDWVILVLVFVFAVRGWIRGFVSQLFAVAGIFVGLWVAFWVSEWVGLRWVHARPTAVFWTLRALVVVMAGLATASVFAWVGGRVRKLAEDSPVDTLDRMAGLALGAAFGGAGAAVLLAVALLAPVPRWLRVGAVQARATPQVVSRAAMICSWGRGVPGAAWLERTFLSAERRLEALQPPA